MVASSVEVENVGPASSISSELVLTTNDFVGPEIIVMQFVLLIVCTPEEVDAPDIAEPMKFCPDTVRSSSAQTTKCAVVIKIVALTI